MTGIALTGQPGSVCILFVGNGVASLAFLSNLRRFAVALSTLTVSVAAFGSTVDIRHVKPKHEVRIWAKHGRRLSTLSHERR
jgi:hypothetical protein